MVAPRYTTTDHSECDARAKPTLQLSEATYTCSARGCAQEPRDRNSAAVIVARAGFDPFGIDHVRLDSPPGNQARSVENPQDLSVGRIQSGETPGVSRRILGYSGIDVSGPLNGINHLDELLGGNCACHLMGLHASSGS